MIIVNVDNAYYLYQKTIVHNFYFHFIYQTHISTITTSCFLTSTLLREVLQITKKGKQSEESKKTPFG